MVDGEIWEISHTAKTINWLQMSSMSFLLQLDKQLFKKCRVSLSKAITILRNRPLFQGVIFWHDNSLLELSVDCKEVEKVINSMPTGKAPGNDKIIARVLRNSLPSILPTLKAIIDDSFISGISQKSGKEPR